MERHYEGMLERDIICKEYEQLNKDTGSTWRMLSDTFDKNWKRGDEPHGTMIFTDVVDAMPEPEPVRDLFKEIDELKARVAQLEEVH